jgi:predicted amidohydrolase
MQVGTKVVTGHSVSESRRIIKENLKHDLELIDDALGFRAGATKFLVFPEFFLMGYPTVEPIEEWLKMACINIPGEETDALGEKAKQYNAYIAGNCYATYEEWPKRYDNTSFIINPQGKVIHQYRRIITSYGYSPHDILDDFVKKYGYKGLFPVCDTPLGKFAIFPCGEVTVPEIARCFAFNGAEIFLHPNGGSVPLNSSTMIMSQARAIENMAYFATCCSGILTPSYPPGGSTIYDWRGNVIARAMEGPIEAYVRAPIDIEGLRKLRQSGVLFSLMRLRVEVFKEAYEKTHIWPVNRFLKKPMKDLGDIDLSSKMAVENMRKSGIITPAST